MTSARLHAPRTAESVVDTTTSEVPVATDIAAVLKQLWRVLNAEITVTLPPDRKK